MDMPVCSSLLPWTPFRLRRQRQFLGEDACMTVVTGLVGAICKIYMNVCNRTTIIDRHKIIEQISSRQDGRGLISVSNHTSALDDPLTLAAITPTTRLFDTSAVRWTLCATNRCFTNALLAKLTSFGKALPITRGKGLFQKGMEMALDRINDGDWIHIFPEGTRSPDDVLLPLKPGVGRLIVDAKVPPLVIPFYHSGMDGILRKGETLLGVGRDVHLLIGDAICFDDIIEEHRRRGSQPHVVYAAVTSRISSRLHELRSRLLERIDSEKTNPSNERLK